jgi:hypothetical protein
MSHPYKIGNMLIVKNSFSNKSTKRIKKVLINQLFLPASKFHSTFPFAEL